MYVFAAGEGGTIAVAATSPRVARNTVERKDVIERAWGEGHESKKRIEKKGA